MNEKAAGIPGGFFISNFSAGIYLLIRRQWRPLSMFRLVAGLAGRKTVNDYRSAKLRGIS
jgi:hypothetical protein